jgi:hypothetical protein
MVVDAGNTTKTILEFIISEFFLVRFHFEFVFYYD